MGNAYVYDPKAHTITVAGIKFDDPSDKDKASAEPGGDMCSMTKGMEGDVVFNVMHDDTASITLSLIYGSPKHDVLSAIRMAHRATGGKAVVDIWVKDRNGRTVWGSSICMMKKFPKPVVSKESPSMDWVFDSQNFEAWFGGSAGMAGYKFTG